MTTRLAGALLGAALVAVVPRSSAAQLEVDRLEVTLSPTGTDRVAVVSLRNLGSEPVTLSSKFSDWSRSIDGDNRYHDLGTTVGSCGERLSVFPEALRVEPGATEVVRISLNGDAAAPCWSILFLSQAPQTQDAGRAVRLEIIMMTGVKVFVEPLDGTRDIAIDSARVVRDTMVVVDERPERRTAALLHLRGTGTLQARPAGFLELRRADNSVAASVPIEPFAMLPGADRRLLVPLPALPVGRYVGLVLLDAGGPERVALQLDVEIAPRGR